MAKARRRLQRRRERGGKGDGDSGAFARTMGTLGFSALQEEGLVNVDEWEQILTNETYGMPRYLTVMYWVEVRALCWRLRSLGPRMRLLRRSITSRVLTAHRTSSPHTALPCRTAQPAAACRRCCTSAARRT